MHLADAFIQSWIFIQAINVLFFISICVPWELNPRPFALLTQCSTTEPHEQGRGFECLEKRYIKCNKLLLIIILDTKQQ